MRWLEVLHLQRQPKVEVPDEMYHACDWDTLQEVAEMAEPGDSIGIWIGNRIMHVTVNTMQKVNL